MKLCRDCKFQRGSGEYSKCAHPSVASPVDGKATEYCDLERKDYGYRKSCGPLAKNFEAKDGAITDAEIERGLQNMRPSWLAWLPRITWKD